MTDDLHTDPVTDDDPQVIDEPIPGPADTEDDDTPDPEEDD